MMTLVSRRKVKKVFKKMIDSKQAALVTVDTVFKQSGMVVLVFVRC